MYRTRFQDNFKVIFLSYFITVCQLTKKLKDLCKPRNTKLYFKTYFYQGLQAISLPFTYLKCYGIFNAYAKHTVASLEDPCISTVQLLNLSTLDG